MANRSCRMKSLSMAGLLLVLAMLALKPRPMFTAQIDKELKLIEEEEIRQEASCTHKRRVKRHDQSMFPSSRPTGARFGKAVRFFGKELIRFTGHRVVTLREFTVDFWMKPEGGQQSPMSVLGLFDYCSLQTSDRGWRIGLKEGSPEKNLRVFFSLRAARSRKSSTILSPLKVEPNVWIHVAATYDGRKMKLYINQANVAVSSDQKGHVFAKALMPDQCESLEAGGDINANTYYRGTIDEVKLWSVAKSHQSISIGVFNNKQLDKNGFILYEDFNSASDKGAFRASWVAVTKSLPEIVKSTIPSDAHDLTISKPPCGSTVCDNPEVVRSYVNNTHLRDRKVLRFRIINVMENDGRNPIVTGQQIQHQTEILNNSFQRYNISWELHEVNVKNTSLRLRTVLYMCSPSKIGDMECNPECDFPITGQDGGDCIKAGGSKCDPSKRGNGKCDLECNRHDHLWDYGDCCNPKITLTHKTCFDPASPYRAYISVREYKTLLNLSNHQYLNVYFAQCGDQCGDMFHGAATFPWEKTVHGILGGVIINPTHFGLKGHSNAIIHEFGHMLGLWHVHHGVSELKCTDECYEHFPSMELGDLCSDTNPTPRNNKCRDPSPQKTEGNCRKKFYKNTPFRNYMSYADDSCTELFSPQQVARMHCYIDLIYQSWQPEITGPSFIPLPPRVIGDSPGKVAITWIPPLGTGGENAKNMCHYCRENSVLRQYAVTAYSPISDKPNGFWAPHQAIGAPDADPCELSPKAWSPLLKTPSCSNCYIELGFKEAMVPTSLSIWVSWHSNNGISDIQLWFEDSTFKSLGNATAQCDTPLTIAIKTDKKVSKVRVYVRDPYTCIDAVQLTSSVLHPNCIRCKPLEYHVTRDPSFTSAKPVVVSQTRFIDQTVEPGNTYQYSIQAVTSSGLKGSPSPVLTYTPRRGFCGDGHVDKRTGEECDDGNVRDGDGCNVRCKKEDVFHCQGHPSLCYRHDGDGVCEDFERTTSIKDCGFYTPDGFEDQWTFNATANPHYQEEECPETVVVGSPSRDLVCKPEVHPETETSWAPCGHSFTDEDYWLDVMFERPVVPAAVVIYIASDGQTKYSEIVKTVEAELIDTSGNRHPSGSKPVNLSCKTNPAIIPVQHDMTKQFFYSQKVRIKFRSFMIAIAGVALRSLTKVDPVAMAACRPDELFNPRTQKCHKYDCVKPSCEPLVIKHATVKCEGNEEGQRCTVTCAKGYLPRSYFKLLCLHGKWRGAVKGCLPVNCGIPKIPNAKPDCPKGTLFGAVCTFRCIQHAKRNGNDNSITCEDDSKWSVQRSFCLRTCAPPTVPLNSVPLSNSNTCVNGKQKRFFPGMACKFRCKPGYRLVKDRLSSSRKTLKLRCTKEGKWALNSRCEPMTCKLPPPHILRWYNCSNGNAPGSVCTSLCPSEKSHQVKCGINLEWSPKFIKCKSAKSCGKLEAPGLNFVCDEYGLEETCKVKCLKPNHDAVVKGAEDKWDVLIKCNDKRNWVPDPRMIVCLPKCRKDIGDGFCDIHNNNKHCRWDGGDCCLSTSKRRLVLRIPPGCKEDCDCKDPNAIENKSPRPGSGAGIGSDDDDDDDDDDSPGDSGGENRSHKIETKQ